MHAPTLVFDRKLDDEPRRDPVWQSATREACKHARHALQRRRQTFGCDRGLYRDIRIDSGVGSNGRLSGLAEAGDRRKHRPCQRGASARRHCERHRKLEVRTRNFRQSHGTYYGKKRVLRANRKRWKSARRAAGNDPHPQRNQQFVSVTPRPSRDHARSQRDKQFRQSWNEAGQFLVLHHGQGLHFPAGARGGTAADRDRRR